MDGGQNLVWGLICLVWVEDSGARPCVHGKICGLMVSIADQLPGVVYFQIRGSPGCVRRGVLAAWDRRFGRYAALVLGSVDCRFFRIAIMFLCSCLYSIIQVFVCGLKHMS